MKTLDAITKLTDSYKKLPSVGSKSAERMAYATLEMEDDDVTEFLNAIKEVKAKIHHCPICGLYTEDDICEICKDTTRDKSLITVISSPKDAQPFEKIDSYNGVYHVLGGVISATGGTSVDNLKINELIDRVKEGNVKEIIIATNPTIEGETTALYIAKLLEDYEVKVTRLAYGLPMGGHLDYTDSLTLDRAIKGRTNIKEED